jgi:hypothetical protein
MRHLGNNAVSIATGASALHVGRGLNGRGLGNNAVSVASRTSTLVIGGNFSGGDVGEGIHLSVM